MVCFEEPPRRFQEPPRGHRRPPSCPRRPHKRNSRSTSSGGGRGDPWSSEELLDKRADVNAIHLGNGKTPLDLARLSATPSWWNGGNGAGSPGRGPMGRGRAGQGRGRDKQLRCPPLSTGINNFVGVNRPPPVGRVDSTQYWVATQYQVGTQPWVPPPFQC